MKKYTVMSADSNPEYLFFVPLACAFWKEQGYEPYVILIDNDDIPLDLRELVTKTTENLGAHINHFKHVEGYRTCNIAQISRLYAAADPLFKDDDYIMTDDIDKFVISKPWFNQQDSSKDIHIFDIDETNYTRLKIGYIGMKTKVWKEVMGISDTGLRENIEKCLADNLPKDSTWTQNRNLTQREKERDQAWNLDEYLLTKSVFGSRYYPDKCQMIERGGNHLGLRNGRIDRTFWKETLSMYLSTRIIDVHLHRDPYKDWMWRDIKLIMSTVFSPEEIQCFQEYKEKFVELL